MIRKLKSVKLSLNKKQLDKKERRGYLRDGLHLLLLGVGSSAVQHLEEVWRLGPHACVNVGLRERRAPRIGGGTHRYCWRLSGPIDRVDLEFLHKEITQKHRFKSCVYQRCAQKFIGNKSFSMKLILCQVQHPQYSERLETIAVVLTRYNLLLNLKPPTTVKLIHPSCRPRRLPAARGKYIQFHYLQSERQAPNKTKASACRRSVEKSPFESTSQFASNANAKRPHTSLSTCMITEDYREGLYGLVCSL